MDADSQAIFDRYNIVSEADLTAATSKAAGNTRARGAFGWDLGQISDNFDRDG